MIFILRCEVLHNYILHIFLVCKLNCLLAFIPQDMCPKCHNWAESYSPDRKSFEGIKNDQNWKCFVWCLLLQIVGLGNHILPDTRHSVGMFLVDCLGKQLAASWQFDRKSMGHIAATKINGQQLILLKPTVAMNLNGNSILKTGTPSGKKMDNVIVVETLHT